ncbi:unnamed protein product [Didymodactylos carnosus]|uniref:Uncharacterized protein n=1 Tax=Didymodactylos carnosus TaxID=1234261 RepID=A0A814WFD5_9BILA|nr:unnamed protein product [Didymodactylos carnosus]CAF3966203.1 unnamed protein product [Didymodactylos carnosus]
MSKNDEKTHNNRKISTANLINTNCLSNDHRGSWQIESGYYSDRSHLYSQQQQQQQEYPCNHISTAVTSSSTFNPKKMTDDAFGRGLWDDPGPARLFTGPEPKNHFLKDPGPGSEPDLFDNSLV